MWKIIPQKVENYFLLWIALFLKIKVILFYLKNRFQNNISEVDVYLLFMTFSMSLGISLTIPLIMISNDEIAKNLEKKEIIKKREKPNKYKYKSFSECKNRA